VESALEIAYDVLVALFGALCGAIVGLMIGVASGLFLMVAVGLMVGPSFTAWHGMGLTFWLIIVLVPAGGLYGRARSFRKWKHS
jgi:hypothetical protein